MRRKRSSRNGGTFYRKGDNNLIDDRTGFSIKASDSRKEWNGLVVHKDQWEERHPQDFVRGRKEKIKAAIVRSDTVVPTQIDGTSVITGNDSSMTGSNNWTGANLGTFDVNSTVSGKMYLLGDGGADSAALANSVTVDQEYFITIYARLNAGSSTPLRAGDIGGTTGQYIEFMPMGTERIFSGLYTAASTTFTIGLATPGFSGVAFEIDRVTVQPTNTNSVSAGDLT